MSVRQWGAPRRNIAAAVGCFVGGAVLLEIGVFTNMGVELPLWYRLVPLGLVCIGLALRTIAPITGLAIGTVGFGVDLFIGLSVGAVVVYTDNIYSAAVRGPRRTPRYLLVANAVCSVALGVVVALYLNVSTGVAVAAILAVVLVSPVATGVVVKDHRDRAVLERDRAAKIAELAEVDRRAALAEERNRMARELHDTIANHFSAIAIQSSAVLSRTGMDADSIRDVVASIRANSIDGLADMRHTIEVLRTNDGSDDPVQHRIADLGDLTARMEAAGLVVSLSFEGEPRTIPVSVEFAAYRIAQEALTNALKHGRDATVSVSYLDDRVCLTVMNRLSEHPAGVPGSGTGLDSMRERATILGGSFVAGPHRDGWRVHTELPIERS